jgi:hypothetical protein
MASGNGTILALSKSARQRLLCRSHAQLLLKRPALSGIRGTFYGKPRSVQHVGVNHRGGDIGMAQEFLDCPDVIVRFKKLRGKGVPQGAPFHLAGNHPVAKPGGFRFYLLNRTFSCRLRRSGLCKEIIRKEDFIKNLQRMLGLPDLPVGNFFTLLQGGQKSSYILCRASIQAFPGEKIDELLCPSHVVLRTIRRYPVFLRAPPCKPPRIFVVLRPLDTCSFRS